VFETPVHSGLPKAASYEELTRSLAALVEGETDALANLANATSLLANSLDRINWCGFYLMRGEDLVLGPFQGKPGCVRIRVGKGVCGAAAERRQTVVVPDVSQFPGHIACDPASRSEIAVPVIENDILRGVLDVDSPEIGRFDEEDRAGLEKFVAALTPLVVWERL